MAKVVVSREGSGYPVSNRDTLKPGTVFRAYLKSGPGRNIYVSLGSNGRAYSVNLGNGELASTSKTTKKVYIAGKAQIQASYWPHSDRTETTRGAVRSGQLFVVKGHETVYMHLGSLNDGRFCSVNLSDPLNDNAMTHNAGSHVTIVGEGSFKATVA